MEVSALSSLNSVEQIKAYNNSNISSLEVHRESAMLESWMFSEALDKPLHEVEAEQSKRSLEANRLMLQAHIRAKGTGEVGPQIVGEACRLYDSNSQAR